MCSKYEASFTDTVTTRHSPGLVADPILLVLDEPTEGLDVEA